MLKSIMRWLNNLLGLGFPIAVSMSGTLTGQDRPPGSSEPVLSTSERVFRHLNRAELFIEMKRYHDAVTNLQQADSLMITMTPHTSEFDRLDYQKTHLWHQIPAQFRPTGT